VTDIVARRIAARSGLGPRRDEQVLRAVHRGPAGAGNLNLLLHGALTRRISETMLPPGQGSCPGGSASSGAQRPVPGLARQPLRRASGLNEPETPLYPAAQTIAAPGLADTDVSWLALPTSGLDTVAFDVSPTAIARCRERFPRSPVRYRIADVLNPPDEWRGQFGLVVEINTIQSLPRADRPAAIAAIAGAVARDGLLFVRCRAGGEDEPDGPERPWPVRRSELDGFSAAGLTQVDLIDHAPVPAAFPFLRVIYQRSPHADPPIRHAVDGEREVRDKRA